MEDHSMTDLGDHGGGPSPETIRKGRGTDRWGRRQYTNRLPDTLTGPESPSVVKKEHRESKVVQSQSTKANHGNKIDKKAREAKKKPRARPSKTARLAPLQLPLPDPSLPFHPTADDALTAQRVQPNRGWLLTKSDILDVLARPVPGLDLSQQHPAPAALGDAFWTDLVAALRQQVQHAPRLQDLGGGGPDSVLKGYVERLLRGLMHTKNRHPARAAGQGEQEYWAGVAARARRQQGRAWLRAHGQVMLRGNVLAQLRGQGVSLDAERRERLGNVIEEAISDPAYHIDVARYLDRYLEHRGPHCASGPTLMLLVNHFVAARESYIANINHPEPSHRPIASKTKAVAPLCDMEVDELPDNDDDDEDGQASEGLSDADVQDDDVGQLDGGATVQGVDILLVQAVDRWIGYNKADEAGAGGSMLDEGMLAALKLTNM